MPILKILVTGGTGFVGSHILDRLVHRRDTDLEKIEIYATRRYHLSRRDKVEHLEEKVIWLDCDLTESIATTQLIRSIQPDEIYHMAAESFVSPSWAHPIRYMDVNYNGTVNILDAIRNYSPKTKILLPGSGEEYGLVLPTNLPITSSTELQPVNPYAVSKIAQDLIGYVYFKSYGLNVIRLRTFNHEGPRREKYFGIASFCYQIARMEAGLQEKILKVGDTSDKRNFTHVKDIINAYELAMKKAEFGKLYLVGSENSENIDTFDGVINKLKKISKIGDTIKTIQVLEFTRPTAVPYLLADATEFAKLTNWAPTMNLDEILEDVLSYWRIRIRTNPNM